MRWCKSPFLEFPKNNNARVFGSCWSCFSNIWFAKYWQLFNWRSRKFKKSIKTIYKSVTTFLNFFDLIVQRFQFCLCPAKPKTMAIIVKKKIIQNLGHYCGIYIDLFAICLLATSDSPRFRTILNLFFILYIDWNIIFRGPIRVAQSRLGAAADFFLEFEPPPT